MSQLPSIRSAKAEDASGIIEIYAPFIRDATVSFELEVPSELEMEGRILSTQKGDFWLVYEWNNKIAGYAYSSLHRSREAYQWTREVSVYVHPDFHRRGIARNLYQTLFEVMKLQGIHNLLAGVTLPNPKSVAFHESLGFRKIGSYTGIGYKFGDWRSTGWWEMRLQALEAKPGEIVAPAEIRASASWKTCLEEANQRLQNAL